MCGRHVSNFKAGRRRFPIHELASRLVPFLIFSLRFVQFRGLLRTLISLLHSSSVPHFAFQSLLPPDTKAMPPVLAARKLP